MDFVAVVDQVIVLLRQRGRLTYRTLQLQFQLDEAHLEVLKDESSIASAWRWMRMAGSWSGLRCGVRVCHCLSASRHRSLDATYPYAVPPHREDFNIPQCPGR